jgi:hypothetical protein
MNSSYGMLLGFGRKTRRHGKSFWRMKQRRIAAGLRTLAAIRNAGKTTA